MILKDKVAVVYGAGGAIGGEIAKAFASEGAKVFVTGHNRASVDKVAQEIIAAGGSAEAATVDALDEKAIDAHLQYVIDHAGRIDISFNAIGVHNKQILGMNLVDINADTFLLPIKDYTLSYFLTARLAARRMVPNKSGVIMTLSALPARTGTTLNGGYGPAQAAKEAMTRDLSAELSPQGIRVVTIRPHGLPETQTMRNTHQIKVPQMTYEQFSGYLASMSHPKRVQKLAEVGGVAAFMASDKASGMTGTAVNLTMGSLDD